MGFFENGPYDLDGDGNEDAMETFVGMQMFAGSRQEALDLTGDDTFYLGDDDVEDDENNGFHDEFDDIDDYDDADEYDDDDPDDSDDWD